MDVHAENRGRPHPKVRFFAAPVMGRIYFDPGAFGRKGQECLREISTEKFTSMLIFLLWKIGANVWEGDATKHFSMNERVFQ